MDRSSFSIFTPRSKAALTSRLHRAVLTHPDSRTASLTLKGVTGDTGVALHLTDPTTIALASSVTTFCLTAGGTVTGLRIYWS